MPAAIEIVSGDEQDGVVGADLEDSLVVRVTDRDNRPVAGALVRFVISSGNGSLASDSGPTGVGGLASARWQLGTSTADTQRVTASIVDPDTLSVTFHAAARPGPPHSLLSVAGDGQEGFHGALVAESLTVRVVDRYGNAISGETVRWAVSAGGGLATPGAALSDSGGVAKASWRLGILGVNTVRASTDSAAVAHVVFNAVATRILWRHGVGTWTWSPPAVGSDGAIYYGARDSTLRAVNPDGTLRWSYRVEGTVEEGPSLGSNGEVFFGVYPGHSVYALRADGTLKWRFDAGNPVRGTPAIGADGSVYVLSVGNGLFAIDPSGSQRWFRPIPGAADDSPVVGRDGTVYAPAALTGRLYAITPTDSLRWVLAFPGDTVNNDLGTPAIGDDGTVYLLAQDRQLYAVDTSGMVKWAVPLGNEFLAAKSAPAIATTGEIYVGGFGGGLWAVSPTGVVVWNTGAFTSTYVFTTPALASDGTIYFVDAGAVLHAVESSGTELWSQGIGGQTTGSPAIGQSGLVYFGSSTGGLVAIEGSAPLMSGGWPMFMHDLVHSGRRP